MNKTEEQMFDKWWEKYWNKQSKINPIEPTCQQAWRARAKIAYKREKELIDKIQELTNIYIKREIFLEKRINMLRMCLEIISNRHSKDPVMAATNALILDNKLSKEIK